MGVCDSSGNTGGNNYPQSNNLIGAQYFPENNTNNNQNSGLILNNDVLVSDINDDPEKKYQKIKLLGDGAFGEVWLVRNQILGKDLAMKIIEKSPHSNVNQITNEINILKKLDHPNILKILDFHLSHDKFYLITDYCPEGELFNEIQVKKIFSEKEAAPIIYQVLSAIRYCHKMRIIHRDIKPENIMIMSREDNGLLQVKLIDFGTAKLFAEGNKQKSLVGSSYYIAPEVLRGKYDESCDLWSIGVIMYILLTGGPPFSGNNDDEILNSVSKGVYDTNSDVYRSLSDNAKDLMSKLLKYNPNERITAKDSLNHPWFKTPEFTNSYKINQVNQDLANLMMKNLDKYKSDNIIKCAVLAYLVHQNTNIKQCKDASKLFIDIDLNKDGKLEKNELEYALKKYCGFTQEQAKIKANTIFSNIDTDNNGFIESEEFIRACIDPKIFTSDQYIKFAFDYFDNDKNGSISINEIELKFFQSAKNKNENTKMELRKMFDQIDINKDGEISYEEFSKMIKSAMI